ncbi:MAG: hypothetical protein SGJ11_06035 [Phycisphaerae bacterium]|nr:hypothetical protein [Phycisphaerae bacterium]
MPHICPSDKDSYSEICPYCKDRTGSWNAALGAASIRVQAGASAGVCDGLVDQELFNASYGGAFADSGLAWHDLNGLMPNPKPAPDWAKASLH